MLKPVKYITIRKIFNFILVYSSFALSSIFKRVIVWGYPYSITTEPTNNCNLGCLECPTGNKTSSSPKGNMNFEIYKKIIDNIKNYIVYQMLYFQGEPFLNPDLFKMINYSEENHICTSLSTNGHFLNKKNCKKIIQSGLKKIIISMDGISQESYQKYRKGGKLDTVIDGIKNLVLEKEHLKSRYPKIIIQFLVFSHNENEIPIIKDLCKELKVNKLELKSAQIINTDNNNLIPKQEKYSRYYKIKNQLIFKNKLKNMCYRIWSTAVFSWDGFLIPCCFDKDLKYKFGNIINQNTLIIWKSKGFNKFRKQILSSRKSINICSNCTEGLKI